MSDSPLAASTTMPTTASRSRALANRHSIVCREASAHRFQCRHVERFSPTTLTTEEPTASITSSGMSSARSVGRAVPVAVSWRAHATAPVPRTPSARPRHSRVRSASERICFSGRVASVAVARIRITSAEDGRRPRSATYASTSRSVSASISRDRLENS